MNKAIFNTKQGLSVPPVDAINDAGAVAYGFGPKHALAQLASTGCMTQTFYVGAETQLNDILSLAKQTDAAFVAKVAIYAREKGFMKDMPALLLAQLLTMEGGGYLFARTFRKVVTDFKMLKNFVQVIRSGVVGRKSLGSAAKKEIQRFFDRQTDEQVFSGSIGTDPSLADVLRLAHPAPKTESRSNLYAYLLGRPFKLIMLPLNAASFEVFKNAPEGAVPPAVNFQLLSNIKMSKEQWAALASTMTWTTLRMNLNTLTRNGVFTVPGMDEVVAKKLADADTIRKTRVFPYQLMAAYLNATDVPTRVSNALQDALEIATENTPELPGHTVVAVDTSGSMKSPVTGQNGSATTKMQCVDVAALFAASILRKNPTAEVIPFDVEIHRAKLNPRDSVATNATMLRTFGGGGTNCAAVLKDLNDRKVKVDTVIYVSDNESLPQFEKNSAAGATYDYYRRVLTTGMAEEWANLKKRCPKAKLVLIDIQPNRTTQAKDDKSVLNVGGFSDRVFDVVAGFVNGQGGDWVTAVEAQDLSLRALL